MVDEAIPKDAIDGSVSPIPINCSPRTVPLASKEILAVLTASMLLWCMGEGDVSLELPALSPLHPVDALLVGPATVRQVALGIDTVDGRCGYRVAGVPDAVRFRLQICLLYTSDAADD